MIPPYIDGIPTLAAKKTKVSQAGEEVHETSNRQPEYGHSVILFHGRRTRQGPGHGGISAGHRDITAGTLGCFCRSTNVRRAVTKALPAGSGSRVGISKMHAA